jgi:hypothetical protein
MKITLGDGARAERQAKRVVKLAEELQNDWWRKI